MSKKIFKSDRYYTITDFNASHSQLLLRSGKDDIFEENVDIIFFNVKYMQIFTSFNGLIIKKINTNPTDYILLDSILNFDENYLFEIETQDNKYYISASFFKVYENDLEFNETSLGLLFKGRDKQIADSTSDK
ncbi:hypothetical protein [Chryseobacterium flavum]|uniref:hypothetical protein n=1 Tax=Chryseobacterium flavum TaxID=415851 RepID=UPI0028A5C6BF|nr:hypothetical protein [Chryseobacterium flavum]